MSGFYPDSIFNCCDVSTKIRPGRVLLMLLAICPHWFSSFGRKTNTHTLQYDQPHIDFFLREVKAWNASMAVDSKHRSGNEMSQARALKCVYDHDRREDVLCDQSIYCWCVCGPIYVCHGRGKLVQNLCFFGTLCFFTARIFDSKKKKKLTSNIEKHTPALPMP